MLRWKKPVNLSCTVALNCWPCLFCNHKTKQMSSHLLACPPHSAGHTSREAGLYNGCPCMGYPWGCMWTWLLCFKTSPSFLGQSPPSSAYSLTPCPASFGPCNLSSCTGSRTQQDSNLVLCFAAAILKFWILHEQNPCIFILHWALQIIQPVLLLALWILTPRKTCWEGQLMLKYLLGLVFDRRLQDFQPGCWPCAHNFSVIHFFIAKPPLPVFLKHCIN